MKRTTPRFRIDCVLHSWLTPKLLTASVALTGLMLPAANAALLLEEGYDYSTGAPLGANALWVQTGTSIQVVSGNLTVPGFEGILGSGAMLNLTAGTDSGAMRDFNGSPLTSGTVYYSTLISCDSLPSGPQYLTGLQSSGSAGLDGVSDPLCLYARPVADGFQLGLRQATGSVVYALTVLPPNTTHLVVTKFTFGSGGGSKLYIDATPGSGEPSAPDVTIPTRGGGDDDDDGGGRGPSLIVGNLQSVAFSTQSGVSQGIWNLDTMRIGTTWTEVAPVGLAVTDPQDQVTCSGTPVTFSVTAQGTPPFEYQWRANSLPIPDATNSTLTLGNPSLSDTLAVYDVVVNNAWGPLISGFATLTLGTGTPAISVSPSDQILQPPASSATFAVVATSDTTLSYQWRADGVPISGATDSSYSVGNLTPTSPLTGYDVVVANVCGSVTSAPPALVRFAHPFFSSDALPGFFGGMNLITTNTSGMTLSVWSSVSPSVPINQWTLEGQMGEAPLNDGSGNSRYSISVNPVSSLVYYLIGETISGPYMQPIPIQWISTDPGGNYTFGFANVSASVDGVLSIPVSPSITRQPLQQTAVPGKTVTFTVEAVGTDPVAYQWYSDRSSLVVLATTPVLTLSNVTSANAGNYFAIVANDYGSVTSSLAPLVVVPPLRVDVQSSTNGIHLRGTGAPGDVYWVEATTNLNPPIAWENISSGVSDTSGRIDLAVDAPTPNRFYRLGSPPDAPAAPVIVSAPGSQTVIEGGAASFAVLAAGVVPLGYQWCLGTGEPLPGATTATLTLSGVTTNVSGTSYQVIATNPYGSVTSSPAILLVFPSGAAFGGSTRQLHHSAKQAAQIQ